MYEHVPLGLKQLLALARFFNTDRFTTDTYSSSGCETCDFGSAYGHEFICQTKNIGYWDIQIKEISNEMES